LSYGDRIQFYFQKNGVSISLTSSYFVADAGMTKIV